MATFGQLIQFGPYFSGGLLCTLKVYHYASGTTTLKDVYTDREKTTTAAQPLASDAAGIASCYGDGLYKFRIDGATDGVTYSTLYTYDKWAVGDQSFSNTGEGAAIVAASTLTLGTDGDFFHVTGATTITAISGSQVRVTLVFDSTPTLTHSGSIIFRAAVSHLCVAGDTFVFVNEGSNVWREESRSSSTTPNLAISGTPVFPDNVFTVGGSADATKKLAFEVDGLTTATTRTMTAQDQDGTVAYTSQVGPSNPIINGNMEVWQRGTSFVAAANASYTADRWGYTTVGAGVVTISRSTDVPTVGNAGVLFNYSLDVDVTTADASLAASDLYALYQRIEGFNWRHFAQRAFVVSFWVRDTKTGLHAVSFANSTTSPDRSYVTTYTINTTDTWEYKTVLVSASPSAGTWDYTTGIGLAVRFNLAAGSNFNATANTWQTGDFYNTAATVNSMDSASNFFRVTGVKLELGSVATPIQYVSFEHELIRAQRYFSKSFQYDVTPAQNTGSVYNFFASTKAAAVTSISPSFVFPTRMRTSPSIILYNPEAANAEVRYTVANLDATATVASSATDRQFIVGFTGNAGGAVGDLCGIDWTAAAEL